MKFKALSILASTLLIISTVHAAEIYSKDNNKLNLLGNIGGSHYFSNNENIKSDYTYMRINLNGEIQINNQLTSYGQWEQLILSNDAERENNSWTRIAFAGLKFGNSSFDYGRNYGVVYDVTSWTGVLPGFGGDTYSNDNFMQQRANGLATYRNTNFFGLIDGLNLAVQYQSRNSLNKLKDKSSVYNLLKQNGEGFGGSLTYNLGEGFSIGGAISKSKRTNSQNEIEFGASDYAKTYTSGLKYDDNNIYLAAQYTQTYNATCVGNLGWANKAQNFEIVAQYQFDFGLRPSIAYLQSKGKDLDNGYGDQDILKYIDIGSIYNFNKNMLTYIDYKINLLDRNDFTDKANISTDNIIAIGLTYQF